MTALSYGERLNKFIMDNLQDKIRKDLRAYRLFSEMDMHAVVYYHLRKALRDRTDWYVRCNLRIAGVQPDIIVFNRYTPKFAMELAFRISDSQSYFPQRKLKDDKESLEKIKKAFPNLGKAYLIAVFDANSDYTYYMKEEKKWEKFCYKEIFINVQEFRGYSNWKEDWITIKTNQVIK